MESFELKGSPRTETGKKFAKQLRRENAVPAVLYGGKESVLFSVKESDLRNLIYTPNVYLIDLTIGKKKHKAIIKEIQFHPVSDRVLHLDLLEVTDDKKFTIAIPVKLVGSAAGTKQGGKLALVTRKLRVHGLAKNIPGVIEIDVTPMEIGTSKFVSDINLDNIELVDPKSTVVATVKLTRAARGVQGEGEVAAEGTPASEEVAKEE
ncbi:MAG: 50S ribosomal protein L25/general stress protein Ctc [Tenuifilaceae bacterium]|jgi:large subunit ribosomal protein L25|nr:50S ribosomal protein L25/general stress protein Ctc [Bacteroidales bacterium]MDI9515455.1 50S ribosomal protein L25/general stress protein Ctc [Bacteroidota bacterium]NLH55963.1 50S ribosomal protein L25/general stress protein Ctc [Rikenellaceae bacterium]OQC63674.1 MAG: 50S ribosomal protein L25 [Bacteroidetes bacterium ADurb.Bin008]HNV81188.1 50S ribosomal protein L25/general stress protein Ctc [Tenuifilaceae bacterium]